MALSVHDFQIAIICALKVECDAVQAVFDGFLEEHGDPPTMIRKAQWDTNVYTTGKIGHHNVVLAHMANYGIGNSAGVAANLRHTFPDIRVAFVVGVCGGMPKNKTADIMLGDVIISTEMVEYGLGRQMTHGLRPTNPLGSRPNTELRGYLNKMQGQWDMFRLQERAVKYLASPSLIPGQTKPEHPGMDKDNLFVSTHRHKHHEKGVCESCDKCLNDNDIPCVASETLDCATLGCHELVNRQPREFPTQPQVHFGKFGSADKVMKSSTERDRLAREYGLIALEMEGAGVWEKIPCFIIKGVCNYSDSHNNKNWQPYTAATAASFFKAFLVPWREVIINPKIVEIPGK
ncbi:nucleoside phosphorylase domain-containing protein [Daldinia loculata]|nr:nucleoside phosphorylase domain-containing protein [Daldinia loculata]